MQTTSLSFAWRVRAGLFLVAVAIFGCSQKPQLDYRSLDLAPVSGTVKLDGQPLAGATVIFENPNKTFSQGKTDANGHFTLMYDSEQAGATPGQKIVRITLGGVPGGDGEDSGGEDESGHPKKSGKLVPEKYNRQSELTREVKPGGASQTFEFDLRTG